MRSGNKGKSILLEARGEIHQGGRRRAKVQVGKRVARKLWSKT